MTTYIALLRGINVGTAKRVAMADLRDIVEDLGHDDVRTVLNSGNVVFEGKATATTRIADALEKALIKQLRVASKVVVVTATDLSAIVKENPLTRISKDPSRAFVGFSGSAATLKKVAAVAREDWKPEALVVGKRAAYLWCPDGVIKSPMSKAMAKAAGDGITTRNLSTVAKIREIATE